MSNNIYVTDCSVDSQFDCDSDHRIIITSMETPMTKKGRWKPKSRKVNNDKIDLKSLKRCDEVKKSFLDAVAREFTKTEQLNSDSQPEKINHNIIIL